jgi:ribulose 1,5-bisphosphate synthetase/thiazole synthase
MQIGTIADRRSIIVGAGPAGSIAGALLSNKGYQVTIVERDAFLAGYIWDQNDPYDKKSSSSPENTCRFVS